MATFSGEGGLYEGERFLGSARYEVRVTPPEIPGGLTRVAGEIVETEIDLFGLFAQDRPPKLTLHMEDGVRWECGLASADGRLHPVGKRLYRVVDGKRSDLY